MFSYKPVYGFTFNQVTTWLITPALAAVIAVVAENPYWFRDRSTIVQPPAQEVWDDPHHPASKYL